jgi:hypothetical protein
MDYIMANIITNKLIINGEKKEVNKVLDFIKVGKEDNSEVYGIGTIDFNKITPMPKWICGAGPNFSGISNKDEEKYEKENTYLEWAKRNWGTKVNAYNLPNESNYENIIYFETKWTGVPNLIQKISIIFPNVVIDYSFYDVEDNISTFIFKNTEVLYQFDNFNSEYEN